MAPDLDEQALKLSEWLQLVTGRKTGEQMVGSSGRKQPGKHLLKWMPWIPGSSGTGKNSYWAGITACLDNSTLQRIIRLEALTASFIYSDASV